jgi:hypothetical protein
MNVIVWIQSIPKKAHMLKTVSPSQLHSEVQLLGSDWTLDPEGSNFHQWINQLMYSNFDGMIGSGKNIWRWGLVEGSNPLGSVPLKNFFCTLTLPVLFSVSWLS